MNRTSTRLALLSSFLLLAGCATSASSHRPIALGALGPAAQPAIGQAAGFRLGAGDALGEQIFTRYVAYVRANRGEHYATGQSPTLDD